MTQTGIAVPPGINAAATVPHGIDGKETEAGVADAEGKQKSCCCF